MYPFIMVKYREYLSCSHMMYTSLPDRNVTVMTVCYKSSIPFQIYILKFWQWVSGCPAYWSLALPFHGPISNDQGHIFLACFSLHLPAHFDLLITLKHCVHIGYVCSLGLSLSDDTTLTPRWPWPLEIPLMMWCCTSILFCSEMNR